MRLWVPLADELGHGYLGRLCSGNMLNQAQLARGFGVCIDAMNKSQTRRALLDRVLSELQMDRAAWVRQHSLVPASMLLGRWRGGQLGLSRFGHEQHVARSFVTASVARMCRDCVAGDRERIGFSYWRRTHQLRGVTWCIKHHRPLSQVVDHCAFETSPHALCADAADLPEREVRPALECEVLRKYSAVLRRFLTEASSPAELSWGG